MTNKLNPKDWRFLSQRQRMSPFPNCMSMAAMCQELRQYIGLALPSILMFFEDRIFTGFVPVSEARTVGEHIIKTLRRRPNLYAQLVKRQHVNGQKLSNFARAAGKRVGSKTSNHQLYQAWASFEKLYHQVYAAYGSVWLVEDLLNEILLGIVKQRIKDEVKGAHSLNVLTRQPKAMVARLEREAFYVLASKIKDKNINSGSISPVVKRLIKNHEKKFFWVTRDYEDPVLTFDKILANLQTVKLENPRQILQAMKNEDEHFRAEQVKLKKQLRFTKIESQLFQAMLDVAFLKELRKRYVSEALYYFDPILMEIGRRAGLTIKQVRFCRTVDIANILLRGQDYTHELNERIKFSVWQMNKQQTEVTTGAKAEKLRPLFLAPTQGKAIKEITGLPVSPGKARGPVRIIYNPDECNKVKKGDIIVTIQVVPSFSPALHRAAGLICDGGHGITTHPAILAREAGIPGIIQTRFAREVLRDGDIVEVDGYKGVARIIKRA